MQKNRIIVWKKWIDPFAEEDDEIDLGEDEEDDEQVKKAGHGFGPVLVGPMGVIPINEHNQPSKVFNFFMGHTNFDIGEEEKDIIETCPGVETLDIYTRYRIRISTGMAFDENEVMDEISKRLCPSPKEQVAQPKSAGIEIVKKHLQENYKYWAIFVLPNGEVDCATGDTKDSVTKQISTYPKQAKVLASWENNNEAEQTSKKNGNERGVQSSAPR